MHFKLQPCFIQLKAFVVKLILYPSYLLMDIYIPLFINFTVLVQYCELFYLQPLCFIWAISIKYSKIYSNLIVQDARSMDNYGL